jgi:hypothetical protein
MIRCSSKVGIVVDMVDCEGIDDSEDLMLGLERNL